MPKLSWIGIVLAVAVCCGAPAQAQPPEADKRFCLQLNGCSVQFSSAHLKERLQLEFGQCRRWSCIRVSECDPTLDQLHNQMLSCLDEPYDHNTNTNTNRNTKSKLEKMFIRPIADDRRRLCTVAATVKKILGEVGRQHVISACTSIGGCAVALISCGGLLSTGPLGPIISTAGAVNTITNLLNQRDAQHLDSVVLPKLRQRLALYEKVLVCAMENPSNAEQAKRLAFIINCRRTFTNSLFVHREGAVPNRQNEPSYYPPVSPLLWTIVCRASREKEGKIYSPRP